MLFDVQPPRVRPRALRTSIVLPLVAVMIWSSGVACLWTNESRLVFQAPRSRYPRPVPGEGVIELRTPDGIRLDAALFKSFPGRKVMLELPGGHNNVGFADESLSRALGEFWSNPR